MMMVSALVLGIASLAAGTHTPQLLVIDRANETRCSKAAASWDPDVTPEMATADAVAEDLHRYFEGLSAQFTPFLEAAWHGQVRFCTGAAADKVLGALAVLVVRPPPASAPFESNSLPGGAEEFLEALASQALIKQLLAIQPANAAERARQRAALAVVRSAIAGRRP
jgi:hypothetical protein